MPKTKTLPARAENIFASIVAVAYSKSIRKGIVSSDGLMKFKDRGSAIGSDAIVSNQSAEYAILRYHLCQRRPGDAGSTSVCHRAFQTVGRYCSLSEI
jgi:hypothetical protein